MFMRLIHPACKCLHVRDADRKALWALALWGCEVLRSTDSFAPCPHYELVLFQGHWDSLNEIWGSHWFLCSRLPFPSFHPLHISGFNLCFIQWFLCPSRNRGLANISSKIKLLDFLPGEQKAPPSEVTIALQTAMAVTLVIRLDRC